MPMPGRPTASMILAAGQPGGDDMGDDMPDSGDMGLESAMSDFIDAVHSKDPMGAAKAFRMAFQMAESQPHEEGPHPGDDMGDQQ